MELERLRGTYGAWASHLGLLPAGQAREQARRIEELGYGCIWVGEARGKEALTHAGFLLAATDVVTVATGIANIWARDARAMLNGARTLAEGFDERFVLGIGASHAPLVESRGGAYDKPLTAMRGYLDAMEEAVWHGPDVADPPLVLAALGPKMMDLAATRSAGAHTFFVPVEHTRRAREQVGDGPFIAPEQAFVLADSRDEARRSADRHLRGYLGLPNYRRNLQRLGFEGSDLEESGSDELFDALVAWGDPDTVAARMREHVAAGADHVAAHPLTADVDAGPAPYLAELAPALLDA